MKLYMLVESDYDSYGIEAIFASEEEAKEALAFIGETHLYIDEYETTTLEEYKNKILMSRERDRISSLLKEFMLKFWYTANRGKNVLNWVITRGPWIDVINKQIIYCVQENSSVSGYPTELEDYKFVYYDNRRDFDRAVQAAFNV